MKSRPFNLLLFLALSIQVQAFSTSNIVFLNKRSCGDGKIDPGEECDPGVQNQTECCDSNCKVRQNLRYTCNQGLGVCFDGSCVNRASQCQAFNNNILSNGGQMLDGPFTPCDPSGSNAAIDVQCTLACSGSALGTHQQVCLDLKQYANVDSIVADGLFCGDSGSGKSMGLCQSGICNLELCGKYRCTNHGKCARDGKNALSCQCDSSFSGDKCDQQSGCDGKVDECGVCNGNGTTCDWQSLPSSKFVDSPTFKNILIPIICIVGVFLIVSILYYVYRRRRSDTVEKDISSGFTSLNSSRVNSVKSKGFPGSNRNTTTSSVGLSVKFDEFKCVHDYEPQMPDELSLKEGDIIFKLFEYDDGWAKGYNTRTQQEGVYPVSFTEKVTPVISTNTFNSTSDASATGSVQPN